jgi:hypothetical protein
MINGTEGYTNCQNTIWDLKGNIKWQFEYPEDENGNPMNQTVIPPYVQEHMHLVYAIRTGNYVNEAEQTACQPYVMGGLQHIPDVLPPG